MGIAIHTVMVPDFANNLAVTDRVTLGVLSVPYGIGGGAGLAVTSVVTFASDYPVSTYFLFCGSNADVTGFVGTQSATGFTLTVEPRLAANTIAAGTMDVLIVA